MNDVKASRRGSWLSRDGGLFARRHSEESGFTIVELVVSLSLLAIVAAPLAGVFWSAIRTAGSAAHRTDGAAVASREIEGMRAVPYDHVGFYVDQNPTVPPWLPPTTASVSLGPTSPAADPSTSPPTLPPQIQPLTPDPKAAAGYLPDPNPNNANPVVFGGVTFTVARYVVWADANGPSGTPTPTTFAQAYKELIVVVTWTDQAGSHRVEQDSLLYPGGLGPYNGPGPSASTTTTISDFPPTAPVLADMTPMLVGGDTQAQLLWTQPAGGGVVTSYTIEWATDVAFTQNVNAVSGLPASALTYTLPPGTLTPSTKYYFQVIAYHNAKFATSIPKSETTNASGAACTFGALNVVGKQSLSTTGTILKNNGQMSEDLSVTWSTAGVCPDVYSVHAADPTSAPDPGSPFGLLASAGSYSATINSNNQKGWAVGLHTFTVWDVTSGKATAVVKTFKVCVNGVGSC